MRRIAWLLLCVCLGKEVMSLNSTQLPPCVVCNALDKFVDNVGGSPSTSCSPKECLASGKLQMFQHASNAMLSSSFITVSHDQVSTSALTDAQTAQLLVLSMLGQHLIHTSKDDDLMRGSIYYFEYDVQHQTFKVIRPLCTFQKNVYTALLILSVVVIVVGISFRMIEKNSNADIMPAASTASNHLEGASQKGQIAFGPPKIHFAWANNETSARYRALNTNAI